MKMFNGKVAREALLNQFPTATILETKDLHKLEIEDPNNWFGIIGEVRAGGLQKHSFGKYVLREESEVSDAPQMAISPVRAKKVAEAPLECPPHLIEARSMLIPAKNPDFVPFGIFNELKMLLADQDFYPLLITGPSGNGKTESVKQVCNFFQMPMIQLNITPETDKFDLMGNYELINGNTVWVDGPVVRAMLMGAVLLVDELDYASGNKLSCLQEVLNTGRYYDKNRNTLTIASKGFTVIATANTKLRGDQTGGLHIGANILNDAFVERFVETLEQDYPVPSIETKILGKLCDDEQFIECLVRWAGVIRKSYKQGAYNDSISTRRMVMICKSFKKRGKRLDALVACLSRFEDRTKEAFIELYKKVDAEVTNPTPVVTEAPATEQKKPFIPF